MSLDPSTLCARTAAGDAELAAPRHGLAIAHRRLLSLLDHPAALDELARRPGILPDRLEKDLLRLAERGLVELHGPPAPASAPGRPAAKAPQPSAAPPSRNDAPRPWLPAQPALSAAAATAAAAPESRVVLGRRVRHGRALILGLLTLVAVCAVAWWFAAPAHEPPPPVAGAAPAPAAMPVRRAEPVPAPAPASVPEPVRVVALPESFVTNPAPASPAPAPAPAPSRTVPGAPAVIAPAIESPAPPPAAPRPETPAVAAMAPTPAPPKAEAMLPKSEPPVSAPPAPVQAAAPAASVLPASVPAPTPAAPPPIQIATAAPSTLPAKAAPRKLEPVAREEPAFPRDALADGVTKGTVRARLAIDASGKVTGVEILDAQPRRVFDRAVTRALARWTYEPGDSARTTDVEVVFSRD